MFIQLFYQPILYFYSFLLFFISSFLLFSPSCVLLSPGLTLLFLHELSHRILHRFLGLPVYHSINLNPLPLLILTSPSLSLPPLRGPWLFSYLLSSAHATCSFYMLTPSHLTHRPLQFPRKLEVTCVWTSDCSSYSLSISWSPDFSRHNV